MRLWIAVVMLVQVALITLTVHNWDGKWCEIRGQLPLRDHIVHEVCE